MTQMWGGWAVLTALAVTAIGTLIWVRKKRVYKKVGYIKKLYFYPVKSLRGLEVTEGRCTKKGFEVNGLLERSFMLIGGDKDLVSQRQCPTLALLSVQINKDKLTIKGHNVEVLTVDVEASPDPKHEIHECLLWGDIVSVIDCGEKAAKWFQDYLGRSDIRLVRYFPELPNRKYTKNHPFYKKLKNDHPVGLQDLSAFHILSQSSIDDLNLKIGEDKISVFNFRPNILVDGCAPYDEDSWEYMKFSCDVEMVNILPVTRCLLTTVEPETGILTQKEPLVTLRKYRIPKDPELLKKTGALPCFGTACFVLKTGEIKLNDEIFATITQHPEMVQK